MKKKLTAILMAVLLSGATATGLGLAQQTGTISEIKPTPPIPPKKYPEVTMIYGVAVDKETLKTEPVVFLRIKYGASETLPGDMDGDCDVDSDDLELFQASYGKSEGEPGYNPDADFDNSGKVDWNDLKILAKNYGKTCPIPTTKNFLIIDDETYKMTKISEKDLETGTKVFQYEDEGNNVMTVIIQEFDNRLLGISAEFKDYIITFKPMYRYRYPRPVTPIRTAEEKVQSGAIKQIEREVEENEASGLNIEKILRQPQKPIAEWAE